MWYLNFRRLWWNIRISQKCWKCNYYDCFIKSVHVPYGVVHTDENQNLVGSTEKPTYMILVNTGVYIVEPDVFNYIGCEEKVDFPTVINRIKNDGKKVGIYPITEDKWLDMGQINELENSRQVLSSLIKEEKWIY